MNVTIKWDNIEILVTQPNFSVELRLRYLHVVNTW